MRVLKPSGNNCIYGTIIEKGTSNGITYLKFSDGTLIQYGVIEKTWFLAPETYSSTVQGITWYRSEAPTVTFPINFIDSNYALTLTVNSNYTPGVRVYMPRIQNKSTTYFAPQLTSVDNFIENGNAYVALRNLSWVAIGKWK